MARVIHQDNSAITETWNIGGLPFSLPVSGRCKSEFSTRIDFVLTIALILTFGNIVPQLA